MSNIPSITEILSQAAQERIRASAVTLERFETTCPNERFLRTLGESLHLYNEELGGYAFVSEIDDHGDNTLTIAFMKPVDAQMLCSAIDHATNMIQVGEYDVSITTAPGAYRAIGRQNLDNRGVYRHDFE